MCQSETRFSVDRAASEKRVYCLPFFFLPVSCPISRETRDTHTQSVAFNPFAGTIENPLNEDLIGTHSKPPREQLPFFSAEGNPSFRVCDIRTPPFL